MSERGAAQPQLCSADHREVRGDVAGCRDGLLADHERPRRRIPLARSRWKIAAAGTFDKLVVSQIDSLTGPIDIAVIPPYSPPPGTGFGIVSYPLRSGTLALGNIDSARGDRFTLSTAQSAISLNALGPSFGTGPSTVILLPGASASATFPGISGLTYRIQKKRHPRPGAWTTAATLPAGPGGIVTDPAPLPPKRFYRIAFP